MKQLRETDLGKIEALADIREDENIRFRTFLKGKNSEDVDEIVHRLHSEITREIDCTQCGNCCIELNPEVHSDDIERYAKLDGISTEEYKNQFCEKDEFEDNICFKNRPCRYLKGKECSIYEIRPQNCRMYPYTQEDRFISRLWQMLSCYSMCPIVFNLMEELKDEMRFR
ncbi:MAG: YkgJ family cysteine cluster protein [Bacteroidales bacterium]|jgi:Fe-S-cluster containining protein|nr:YkgJ family cysteine cluster protein [Bacteroidales bacterium]